MKQVVGPLALGVFFVGMAVNTEGCELFTPLSIGAAGDPGNGVDVGNGGDVTGGTPDVPPLADGQPCSTDGQCQKDHACDERAHICCATECNGACEACNLAGKEGKCAPLLAGTPACNDDSEACNGNRDCAFVKGIECSTHEQCVSGACIGSYCRSELNALCTEDVECASNLCVDQRCLKCTNSSWCHGDAQCNISTGECQALAGQPCSGTLKCASSSACSKNGLCGRQDKVACNYDGECITQACRGTDGTDVVGVCRPCPIGKTSFPERRAVA